MTFVFSVRLWGTLQNDRHLEYVGRNRISFRNDFTWKKEVWGAQTPHAFQQSSLPLSYSILAPFSHPPRPPPPEFHFLYCSYFLTQDGALLSEGGGEGGGREEVSLPRTRAQLCRAKPSPAPTVSCSHTVPGCGRQSGTAATGVLAKDSSGLWSLWPACKGFTDLNSHCIWRGAYELLTEAERVLGLDSKPKTLSLSDF